MTEKTNITISDALLSGVLPAGRTRKRDRKGDAVLKKSEQALDPSISILEKNSVEQIRRRKHVNDPSQATSNEKYSRGRCIDKKHPGIKNKILKTKILDKDEAIKYSEEISEKTEILLGETSGFIEAEDGEVTRKLTQSQIRNSVDITSASKQFDLALAFGPYRLDYTRNGRYLLLGGKRGHVAAFDWVTKRLMCEINVMESVFDVQWLHLETMYAVAQKEWLYVYNNQGVELHCVNEIHRPLRMQFLPYHFLLAASTEKGWLKWVDVTMGKVVAGYNTGRGRLPVLTQNPHNAILCTGHSNGVVAMWSPNQRKPVASILCHKSIVQAVAVNHTGYYMATSACDRDLKIWDIRNLESQPVQSYKLVGGSASDLSFSQTGLLAASCSNTLQIYKDCGREVTEPYLMHRTRSPIANIEFSPYEDILGLGTGSGFTSMIVPGSGEPNFDALEVNPLRSKRQRQEVEVRSLLDKIPAEMITLDLKVLTEVMLPTEKEKWEAKHRILYARAPSVDLTLKNKKKHGKSLRRDQVAKIIRQDAKKAFYNKIGKVKENILSENSGSNRKAGKKSVLDRFRSHKKTS